MSNEVRSPLMFLSQVERGRPGGLFQGSSGGTNSIRFAHPPPHPYEQHSDPSSIIGNIYASYRRSLVRVVMRDLQR